MKAFLDEVKALNDWNWQGGAYQWVFYVGILLVVLLEKKKIVKLVFGCLPVVYLISIYNPVFWKALEFAGVGTNQYFVRMFSFMPLMYTISLGLVNLLESTKRWLKGWFKFLAICGLCIVLIVTGQNIFEQSWYKKATNAEKVSQDTLEVIEALKKDEDGDIRIATIEPVTNYMRQVTDYITPYARDMGHLGHRLMENPPSVPVVMTLAGEADMEYIMTYRTEETLEAFRIYGYEPWAVTTNTAIYKVTGVPTNHRTINENRQVTAITHYDENGNIGPTEKGYAIIAYEYDKNGYVTEEKYLDETGRPFEITEGYATISKQYSSRGLLRSLLFRNASGEAVPYMGWYELKYDYDLYGRIVRESCFDAQGSPMLWMYGLYATRELFYGDNDKIVGEKYYDTEGNPCISELGYAECRREFDKNNRIISEAYFGTDGKPIILPGEYAAYNQEWDDSGNLRKIIYLDAEGEPVISSYGYAVLEREYDENNRVIQEIYLDTMGNPALSQEGYYGFIRTYDDAGNVIETPYVTPDAFVP